MNTGLSTLLAGFSVLGGTTSRTDRQFSVSRAVHTLSQWGGRTETFGVDSTRCTPQNVHLAYHNSADEMTVMWMTPHESCHAQVYYDKHDSTHDLSHRGLSEELSESAPGEVTSLAPSDMCGNPARKNDYRREWHHTAVLRGLEPSTAYTYCVGEQSRAVCNTFTTAPPLGARESFSFVMYGDMGVPKAQRGNSPGAESVMAAVRDEVAHRGARFVMHVGDISYGDGHGEVWQAFMQDIGPVAARVPYMVAVGNHDYDYDHGKRRRDPSGADKLPKWAREDASNGECGVALATRFEMPQSGSGKLEENAPFWYSYDHGSAHFVVISSEHSLKHGGEQWHWLAAHLPTVDRCKTPWLILAIHRPLYVIHPHHSNRKVAKHIRHHIEDLLLKYGVDVVVSGHVHSHSRSCPVADKDCTDFDKGAVMHVITGSGGHKLSKISHHQPHWVRYARRSWGYSRFTIDESDPSGASTLTVDFIETKDGSVSDTATLTNTLRRDGHCAFCYSRSGGMVTGGAAGATPRAGACSPPSSLEDIQWLQEARLARESPEWARALQEEVPRELMLDAGHELEVQSDAEEDGEGAWFEGGQIVAGSVGGYPDVDGSDSDDYL